MKPAVLMLTTWNRLRVPRDRPPANKQFDEKAEIYSKKRIYWAQAVIMAKLGIANIKRCTRVMQQNPDGIINCYCFNISDFAASEAAPNWLVGMICSIALRLNTGNTRRIIWNDQWHSVTSWSSYQDTTKKTRNTLPLAAFHVKSLRSLTKQRWIMPHMGKAHLGERTGPRKWLDFMELWQQGILGEH